MKTLLVGFACLFMLNGCLSNNYQLSRAELFRLARRPAEGRGEHVRVLQQAAPTADDVGSEVADDVASEDADDVGSPDTEYDGSSSIQSNIGVDTSSSHGGRYPRGGRWAFAHSGPGHSGSGPGRFGSVHSGSTNGSSHTTTSSGGGGGFGGSNAVGAAILLVGIAGAVGVYAAVVEGRRFDGWARVHADEPLLLVGPDSSQWLPLSALTERDAAYANHAVIVERDENLLRLSRAPLGRQGFAYEFEVTDAPSPSLWPSGRVRSGSTVVRAPGS